ncbi:hypothetical protein Q4F19_01320 [Sphingomonas sp. BIUV-7]|uniref:Uncharacterized protein n=1 Tax=Sphingomonas natans TaxID=3063330 RepID=A0ABT8Y3X2_9SPHN|nr:hypothetical protein [Sphingomonas sp. BIUV-7]MDO6413012.1 hypothetical protein [Sphingomonas sp. BIUV-7]
MAFVDFNMRVPSADEAQGPVAKDAAASRSHTPAAPLKTPRGTLWIGVGMAAVAIALVFALAFASIGEPIVAAIVTILLLLPAASLFASDGHRRT